MKSKKNESKLKPNSRQDFCGAEYARAYEDASVKYIVKCACAQNDYK